MIQDILDGWLTVNSANNDLILAGRRNKVFKRGMEI